MPKRRIILKIKVTFKTDRLPMIYRHRFMALIKEALRLADEGYKSQMYPGKDSDESKRVKPFAFSVSMPPNRKAVKERIVIDDGVEIEDTVFHFPDNSFLSLYISSSDFRFIATLHNGLLEMEKFRFNDDIIIEMGRTYMLNEAKISSGEAVFKTDSPILLEDKDGKPILPFEDSSARSLQPSAFQDHFNAIHTRILKDVRGEGLHKDLVFTPINLKKQVVKHTLKGFREKTGRPYMTLTSFQGTFKLSGDPRDLQALYEVGIGLRTGQGFGMVEVVGEA